MITKTQFAKIVLGNTIKQLMNGNFNEAMNLIKSMREALDEAYH